MLAYLATALAHLKANDYAHMRHMSNSFHDAKHVHTHTGAKTYRHPFRVTDDRD